MAERENTTEYIILEYVDYVEEAQSQAKDHEMSADFLKGLDVMHRELVEVGNMVDSEARVKLLKADVEKDLVALVKACQEGEEPAALGNMRQLRDRLHILKALWTQK